MTAIPELIVEMGFTAGASTEDYLFLGDAVRGLLDTGTLAPDEIFTDVSGDVRSFTVQRGASRADPVVRYDASTTTTVLRDRERKYDPTNLSGPYVSGGVTQVQPMQIVRHRATWDGVTYSLATSFADSWGINYDPTGRYSEVTLQATDGFKVLAANVRAAVGAVGAGEDAGARVARILDSADWSASDRVIATGDTTVQATTLEGSPLDEIQLVADTEMGEAYIDADGRFVFRNRTAAYAEERSNTSQGTFGDGPGELRFQEIATEYDEQQLVNQVRITRVGGSPQEVEDADSQLRYLIHTYERSDLLMETDAAADDYARYVLAQNKDAELRFSQITINPKRDPDNLYPQVLGRQLGDRITINLRPQSGDEISRDVIIRGITHTVTKSPESWVTTWTLQSASKQSFLVLDNASLGVLDSNALAY